MAGQSLIGLVVMGKTPAGENIAAVPISQEERGGSNPIHFLIRAMYHSFTLWDT
jgi:hypothetical protein